MKPTFSIIAPIFNEAENLPILYRANPGGDGFDR